MYSKQSLSALTFFTLASIGKTQTTTTKLFFPAADAKLVRWDASIVGACSDSTTYALRCTAAPLVLPSNAMETSAESIYNSVVSTMCDPKASPLIITEGPSGFYQAFGTTASGATVTESISCALSGTTEAVCTGTLSAKGTQSTTATADHASYTGSQVPFIDVTITAGVQKLAKATDSVCTGRASVQAIPVALTGMAFVFGICGLLVL